jgi:hypothetical protein
VSATDALIVLLIVLPILVVWLSVLVDIVRRADIGGGAKVVWVLAALFLPLITIVVYIVMRASSGGRGATPAAVQASGQAGDSQTVGMNKSGAP